MLLMRLKRVSIDLLPSFVTALVFWLVVFSTMFFSPSLMDLLGVPPGLFRMILSFAPDFLFVGLVFVGLGGDWSKSVWFVQSIMVAIWIVVQLAVVMGMSDGNLMGAFDVALYALVLYGWVVLPVSWLMLVVAWVVEKATGFRISGVLRRMILG